jgi:hypothetical protein
MANGLAPCITALFAIQAPLPSPRQPPRALTAPTQPAKAFGAAMLAALLTMAPVDEAFAASRSGGRVGGRASVYRSAPSRTYRSTNVYISPPAVVYGGGYGYGYGYGISPGAYLGLSLVEALIREQERQAYLQQQLRTQLELGRDQAKIAELQRQLADQSAKVEGLRSQQADRGSAPDREDAETIRKLQKQLRLQQREIEQLQDDWDD